MKNPSNPVLGEQDAKKLFKCISCGKPTEGHPYGAWGEVGGTCSRACEKVQEAKPRDFGCPQHLLLSSTDSDIGAQSTGRIV